MVLGSLIEEEILIPSPLRAFFLLNFGIKNIFPLSYPLILYKVVTLA